MAYIGLRKPIIGKRNDDGTYEAPFRMGKAISLNITPNYAEGSLYADDGLDEYDKEFTDADVTMGTNTLPIEASRDMFGHKVTGEAPKYHVVHNKDDQSNDVGMGFVSVEKISGIKYYIGTFLKKAKFSEPSDEYETKGNTITYKTPSITGKASADENGDWKETEICETEREAVEWIYEQFGETNTGVETEIKE